MFCWMEERMIVKFRDGFYGNADRIIAIHKVDTLVDGKPGCKVILASGGNDNYVLTLDITPEEAARKAGYSWWK